MSRPRAAGCKGEGQPSPSAKCDGAKTPGLPQATTKSPGERKNKKADEIDSLFANLKESKKAKAEDAKAKKQLKREPTGGGEGSGKKRIKLRKGQGKGMQEEEGDLAKGVRYDPARHDFAIKPWKFDSNGMPIYDPDTMKVNRGGDTALCPFDCSCCF